MKRQANSELNASMKHVRYSLFAVAVALLTVPCLLALVVTAQSNMVLKGGPLPFTPGTPCAQSNAFLARSGATTHDTNYHTLICGMVSDGDWAGMEFFYVFDTQNAATARLNLVSSNFTATVVGSPTFTTDRGYTGVDNSSGNYLDTGFNPFASATHMTAGSAAIGAWALTNTLSSATGGTILGVNDTGSGFAGIGAYSYVAPRIPPNNWFLGILDVGAGAGPGLTGASTDARGDWIVTRSNTTDETAYKNGALLASGTTTSGHLASFNFYVLAYNNNGTGAAGGSDLQVANAFASSGLSAAAALRVHNRLCTWHIAVGALASC
jgi:hypothetical protein